MPWVFLGRRRHVHKLPAEVPRSSSKHCVDLKSATLVDLPVELASLILIELSFEDLLALRLSCKAHDTLVKHDELLRQWTKHRLHPVQSQLSPRPECQLWTYMMHQERAWKAARNTAILLVDYIERKILLHLFLRTRLTVLPTTGYRAAQQNLKTPRVLEHITNELTVRLFMLSHYLRSCKSHLLRHLVKVSQLGDWESMSDNTFQACISSSGHYVSFSEAQLMDVHNTWLFLQEVLQHLVERPHYLGTFEAVIKGMNEKPLDGSTLALALVVGDLGTVRSLLMSRNFCTRKTLVRKSLSGFTEDFRRKLLNLDAQTDGSNFEHGPLDSLWVDGMVSELLMRGMSVESLVIKGTPMTTISLLRDLAGFDFFAPIPGEELGSPAMQTDMFGAPR